MTKTTATYWNVFSAEHARRWTAVSGLEGMVEETTLERKGSESINNLMALTIDMIFIISSHENQYAADWVARRIQP